MPMDAFKIANVRLAGRRQEGVCQFAENTARRPAVDVWIETTHVT